MIDKETIQKVYLMTNDELDEFLNEDESSLAQFVEAECEILNQHTQDKTKE